MKVDISLKGLEAERVHDCYRVKNNDRAWGSKDNKHVIFRGCACTEIPEPIEPGTPVVWWNADDPSVHLGFYVRPSDGSICKDSHYISNTRELAMGCSLYYWELVGYVRPLTESDLHAPGEGSQ